MEDILGTPFKLLCVVAVLFMFLVGMYPSDQGYLYEEGYSEGYVTSNLTVFTECAAYVNAHESVGSVLYYGAYPDREETAIQDNYKYCSGYIDGYMKRSQEERAGSYAQERRDHSEYRLARGRIN